MPGYGDEITAKQHGKWLGLKRRARLLFDLFDTHPGDNIRIVAIAPPAFAFNELMIRYRFLFRTWWGWGLTMVVATLSIFLTTGP